MSVQGAFLGPISAPGSRPRRERTLDAKRRADFEQAVGECFADAVCPPASFELASAHECFEAVAAALSAASPSDFRSLTGQQIDRLARSFSSWFGCAPPTEDQLRSAADAVLRRWPTR